MTTTRTRTAAKPAPVPTKHLGVIAVLTVLAIGVVVVVFGGELWSSKPPTASTSGDDGSRDPLGTFAGNEDDDEQPIVAPNDHVPERPPTPADRSTLKLADIPFDGAAAYEHLKKLCAIGSRTSGTPGMRKQQEMLVAHFKKFGATVELQTFETRHPLDGSRVPLANLIVRFHPERAERILLCAHYDTRPFPDNERDPRKRRGVFLGANDGASGTALLMQLGNDMPKLAGKYGVDFVFFDAEELVYGNDPQYGKFFIGSEHFSREYLRIPPKHRYRMGVLLDMVADAELHLYQDRLSMKYARPIVEEVWTVAKELGVREFIHAKGWDITDDHLPLNEIAGIPTIDIIDFDYPRPGREGGGLYWHTLNDKPENCSALSLAKVGYVVHEWLKRTQKQ